MAPIQCWSTAQRHADVNDLDINFAMQWVKIIKIIKVFRVLWQDVKSAVGILSLGALTTSFELLDRKKIKSKPL